MTLLADPKLQNLVIARFTGERMAYDYLDYRGRGWVAYLPDEDVKHPWCVCDRGRL